MESSVGIGLPTHNGERYIREALDALLAQDYPDIRLFISDNASTDGTPEICLEAARHDDRVAYRRSEQNTGAVGNFNRTFELAAGEYFMWAADDDRWHPSYVRRCVEALRANERAVMATTGLRFIDETGQLIDADYSIFDNPDLSSDSVRERAAVLVRRGGWYQIYGVARRVAIERSRRLRDVYGPDVGLVMELALQGPIASVPDVLFWYRQYQARTEAARVTRQGNLPNEDRVLSAKYTYLQESLSETVKASDLPWRIKAHVTADIIRAAYIEDTPLSRHTRKELARRVRLAIADRDLDSLMKFAFLQGLLRARGSRRRVAQRARRLLRFGRR
jgi:glycosyltransferase involved in cell wall biosynthesis